MIQSCVFDPVRDISATVPGLAVDLVAAIENGVVTDTAGSMEFNEIDSPSSIRNRVRNAFDAVEAQRSLIKGAAALSKAQSSSNEPSTPSGDGQ